MSHKMNVYSEPDLQPMILIPPNKRGTYDPVAGSSKLTEENRVIHIVSPQLPVQEGGCTLSYFTSHEERSVLMGKPFDFTGTAHPGTDMQPTQGAVDLNFPRPPNPYDIDLAKQSTTGREPYWMTEDIRVGQGDKVQRGSHVIVWYLCKVEETGHVVERCTTADGNPVSTFPQNLEGAINPLHRPHLLLGQAASCEVQFTCGL